MKDRTLDETSLEYVLLMAQESLFPEMYEKFLSCFNELIKIRNLTLDPVIYEQFHDYSIEA